MRREEDTPAERYTTARLAGDLDDLRRRTGLSLRELARRSGCPTSTLGDALRGRRFPRLDTVLAVAHACGAESGEWRNRWIRADRERGVQSAGPRGEASGQAPLAELPHDARHFAGRRPELARLRELVHTGHSWPAIVVSGVAGVGKSALAVHWARRVADRFPDGQVFLDLHGHQPHRAPLSPEEALEQLVRALGTEPERLGRGMDERVRRYRSLVAGKELLVVLDDAVTEEQVRPLLPGSPGSLVIVTSRHLLAGLVARDDAFHLPLGVLDSDEARTLLHDVLGSHRVAEADLDDLARLCGYLPLALRIAAAHLVTGSLSSIQELIGEMVRGNRLSALSAYGDGRAAVRSAFDLSYRTVSPDAARLFRRVGLVPGSDVTVGAAAALADIPVDGATRLLRVLNNVCLVQQHTTGRYRMHDLVRLYAAERAAEEDGDVGCAAAIARLLDWYLCAVAEAARRLYPTNLRLPDPNGEWPPYTVDFQSDDEALAWLDAERANLAAAVQYAARHGPHPAAWRLADVLRGYFNLRSHAKDWFATAQAGLDAARVDGDRRAEAATEHNLGLAHSRLGSGEAAIAHFTHALALYRELDHAEGCAYVLLCLSGPYRQLGEPERAVAVLEEALEVCRQHALPVCEAKTLGDLGEVYRDLGWLRLAVEHQRQALATLQRMGLVQHEALALLAMGAVCHELGEWAEALEYEGRALDLFRAAGNRDGEAYALLSLAVLHSDEGRDAEALACATPAVALTDDIGDDCLAVEARCALGQVHLKRSDPDLAGTWHRAALDLALRAGYRHGQGKALLGLAAAHLAAGGMDEAIGYAEQALVLGEIGRYRLVQGRALTILAEAHHETGSGELARRYARRALALHRQTGHHGSEARVRAILQRAPSGSA